jgi:CheY-like chemotaxis protein
MQPETRRRALEPFFTTKAVGEGTGLGLSMVYGFVKQSGGHLSLYSEAKQGTTINLYFPALPETASEPVSDQATPAAPPRIGSGQLVLVVEDDPLVMRLSEGRLTAMGFRCLTATTGDAAWSLVRERDDIALVFTDLVMPGQFSGLDLAERIAEHRPQVPVLMTSGFSDAVLKDKGGAGGVSVLRKPYRLADLAEALQAIFAEG